MTDCICRFQGRALDGPQTDASSDGSVPSGRDLARVPNAEAVKAAFVKSAAGIKTAEDPQNQTIAYSRDYRGCRAAFKDGIAAPDSQVLSFPSGKSAHVQPAAFI